ncbi:hypothetical protein [Raineyella fluvialis]|uniref:Uncharacterized protein n=1 Tax=Raineyella fluvialis TaxID=2662261 RepID=A0A5Q2FFB1_9ACTN|nr:hypothetical protein [Raineyella fluvialis]QGF23395.1 hypothetical protein Rai3103_06645 [Raineyella fluvialis]
MTRVAEAAHILVTSYPPEDEPVSSVERVVQLADLRLAYWLPNAIEARERFAGGPVVSVRPCSRGGKPELAAPLLEGRVEVVTEGPLFDETKAAIKAKYGLGVAMAEAVDRARRLFGDRTPEAVVVVDIVA